MKMQTSRVFFSTKKTSVFWAHLWCVTCGLPSHRTDALCHLLLTPISNHSFYSKRIVSALGTFISRLPQNTPQGTWLCTSHFPRPKPEADLLSAKKTHGQVLFLLKNSCVLLFLETAVVLRVALYSYAKLHFRFLILQPTLGIDHTFSPSPMAAPRPTACVPGGLRALPRRQIISNTEITLPKLPVLEDRPQKLNNLHLRAISPERGESGAARGEVRWLILVLRSEPATLPGQCWLLIRQKSVREEGN